MTNADTTPIKSKDELERELLQEQILEKQRTRRGFSGFMQLATFSSSIGALVAAIVALMVARTDAAKQIHEAYELRASYYQTKTQLAELTAQHEELGLKVDEARTSLALLEADASIARSNLEAMRDAQAKASGPSPTGVDVTPRVVSHGVMIRVTTYPPGAKASALIAPRGIWVLPGREPPLNAFPSIGREYNGVTPCEFGPFAQINDNDVWIYIDYGSSHEWRLVSISSPDGLSASDGLPNTGPF